MSHPSLSHFTQFDSLYFVLTYYIPQEKGYWASYNNPYFQDIRDLSGTSVVCAEDPSFCYDEDPRAKLFSRLQSSISDLPSLQQVLDYNHFAVDAESGNDACAVRFTFLLFYSTNSVS